MKNFIRSYKKYLGIGIPFIFIFVIYDIFNIEGESDIHYFGIIVLYLLVVRIVKAKSYITFVFNLLLLLLMSVRYFWNGPDIITEEIAVWFVLFFVVGLIQKWKEL